MSINIRQLSALFAGFLLSLQIFTIAHGQLTRVRIKIADSPSPSALVEGADPKGIASKNPRNLSFDVFGVTGAQPSGRITDLKLFDGDGSPIQFRKMVEGEFLAESDINGWAYKIDLSPPQTPAAAAHVSWIKEERGILMLADLIPRLDAEHPQMEVRIELPSGFPTRGEAVFAGSYSEVSRTVLPVGKGWREAAIASGGADIRLIIAGDWLFEDAEAAAMAGEIFDEYRKIFGAPPLGELRVILSKFPQGSFPNSWQAETRGRTVTVISGDMPFKTQSLQRLHEQLRHEMFHLWLPNAVNLKGSYDWFYEGAAVYQSLKTAVRLNRIRFDDYLDTLSRAFEIDSAQTSRTSLIDASRNRSIGSDTQIYARGMIVAFLCDLVMLSGSRGKTGIEAIERRLFAEHPASAPAADGNAAVLAEMERFPGLRPIIQKYIKGSEPINWTAELSLAGIEATNEGRHSILKVREKLSGRQKAVLDDLGYNSWRKLSGNHK